MLRRALLKYHSPPSSVWTKPKTARMAWPSDTECNVQGWPWSNAGNLLPFSKAPSCEFPSTLVTQWLFSAENVTYIPDILNWSPYHSKSCSSTRAVGLIQLRGIECDFGRLSHCFNWLRNAAPYCPWNSIGSRFNPEWGRVSRMRFDDRLWLWNLTDNMKYDGRGSNGLAAAKVKI